MAHDSLTVESQCHKNEGSEHQAHQEQAGLSPGRVAKNVSAFSAAGERTSAATPVLWKELHLLLSEEHKGHKREHYESDTAKDVESGIAGRRGRLSVG